MMIDVCNKFSSWTRRWNHHGSFLTNSDVCLIEFETLTGFGQVWQDHDRFWSVKYAVWRASTFQAIMRLLSTKIAFKTQKPFVTRHRLAVIQSYKLDYSFHDKKEYKEAKKIWQKISWLSYQNLCDQRSRSINARLDWIFVNRCQNAVGFGLPAVTNVTDRLDCFQLPSPVLYTGENLRHTKGNSYINFLVASLIWGTDISRE